MSKSTPIPMVRYIHHLLAKHGEETMDSSHGPHRAVSLQVILRGQLQPMQGAVRVCPEFPELFEMLSLLQIGTGQQAMGTFVFAGEDVESVLFVAQAGQLVEDRSGGDGMRRTPGGLVVG